MGQIQYGITQQHQQLFVIAPEDSAQRLLPSFNHYSVSDPLPELRLCGPKLFSITTNDQSRLLLSLLFLGSLFLIVHLNTPRALHAFLDKADRKRHTPYPVGKPLLRGSIELSKTQPRNVSAAKLKDVTTSKVSR